MMPRKSEAMHEVQGTISQAKSPADLSGVPAGRPRVPADINALGLRPKFKRLCALLAERRVLTNGDVELVRLFCIIQDRHVRNAALLREEGEICEYVRLDSNGVAHPQVRANLRLKVCVEAERQMASILSQLGMTPTAKDRAKPTKEIPVVKELTDEEKYMQGIDRRNGVLPIKR